MVLWYLVVCLKCDGENFVWIYYNDVDEIDFKCVKFDVWNFLILVVDVWEDDVIFDVDVIGGSNVIKWGVVNFDGYDSDLDNENINVCVNSWKKGNVNIIEKLDSYVLKGGENG